MNRSRREFFQSLPGAAMAGLVVSSGFGAASEASGRPNLLILLADDMGYADPSRMKQSPPAANGSVLSRCLIATIILAFTLSVVRGETELAGLFQDHAVLQRDLPVPVWGRAEAGQKVTVTFGDQTHTTTAAPDCRWSVTLSPMPASTEPKALVVVAEKTLRVEDVVVGEVWLCSGQSNMEWPVSRAANAETELAAANHPLLRFIKIGVQSAMPPASSIKSGAWRVCSPTTAGSITAVGYHFAREMQSTLGIPIGIIDSTWGGTTIEAWMSDDSLFSDPELATVFENWGRQVADYPRRRAAADKSLREWEAAQEAARARGETPSQWRPPDFWGREERVRPMGLYGGMVAPLIPYAIRGLAWYQGESNAGQTNYHHLLAAMIAGWRKAWREGNFPVLVVQLPNYEAEEPGGTRWAIAREQQARAVAEIPNAALAVTIDLGDPKTVHPLHKRGVGHRLALLALNRVYGQNLEAEGPTFEGLQVDGHEAIVRFTHAHGLHSKTSRIPGFEIAGSDGKFVPADARIEGEAVHVSAPEVAHPVAVRYAWRNDPETSLYNAAGLAAAPFRTDG
jgi:sialate O-acetylesterase